MLFDAHARDFAAFGRVLQRGIYGNMKASVDKVGLGKKRVINVRFEAMTEHYLFEPEFCDVASGWEKGIVEKNMHDRRTSWSDWPVVGGCSCRRRAPQAGTRDARTNGDPSPHAQPPRAWHAGLALCPRNALERVHVQVRLGQQTLDLGVL